MTNADADPLRSLVDSSGFAFQLAVEQLVAGTPFTVLTTEHGWVHPRTLNSGFADIVLEAQGGVVRLVVECKRVRGGDWVFLLPEKRTPDVARKSRRVDVLWTAVSAHNDATGFDHMFFNPETAQCPFCVVRGSGEGQQPMLERLAGHLLETMEAIADEQKRLDLERRANLTPAQFRVYAPVIVTNAQLHVCVFDPAKVNPTDGLLPSDAEFFPTPFVRFFKNLTTDINASLQQDLKATNKAKNRTVFVVNAPALQDFLKSLTSTDAMPASMRQFRGL